MSYSILSDREITALCQKNPPMLAPFVDRQEGKPSWGLGSFGYDLRLGKKFLVPLGGVNVVLDPVDFPRGHFREVEQDRVFELAPNSQVLAESMEIFNMPEDVVGVCWGKSSYARCGLLVNVTPLECFDDQTEILTVDGWKAFEVLSSGEHVATIDQAGVLSYQPILARQKRWYEGELIAINSKSLDLLVTPGHQLYVRRQHKPDFELVLASEVEGCTELEFKSDCICTGTPPAGTPWYANPGRSNAHDAYRIRLPKSDSGTPRIGDSETTWSRKPYRGYVYDVTVPNHTIYVRRNGKAIWSGNCGWRGKLTIELANLSPLPIRLHVGQGIAQVVFFRGKRPGRTYGEKESGGGYQDQPGVTLPY